MKREMNEEQEQSILGILFGPPGRQIAVLKDEKRRLLVSTIQNTDYPEMPYETGVEHPLYNNGRMIIITSYRTEDEAKVGHERCVGLFSLSDEELPDIIHDSGKNVWEDALDRVFGEERRTHRKMRK